MPSNAPGSFCWIELATTDTARAKRFYGKLFGWSAHDSAIGPGQIYTTFRRGGGDVGACYTLGPEMARVGVPPHWDLYIAVSDADTVARKAQGLGGTIVREPFDVLNSGRMAVLRDPTGGTFSIWQAMEHAGFGVGGVEGSLCAADLNTYDQDLAGEFYADLFGWTVGKEDEDPGHNYYHFFNAGSYIGGILPPSWGRSDAPPHWLVYLGVSDCAAAAMTTQENGGRVFMPPTAVEDLGQMAVVADPEGAAFALFQQR